MELPAHPICGGSFSLGLKGEISFQGSFGPLGLADSEGGRGWVVGRVHRLGVWIKTPRTASRQTSSFLGELDGPHSEDQTAGGARADPRKATTGWERSLCDDHDPKGVSKRKVTRGRLSKMNGNGIWICLICLNRSVFSYFLFDLLRVP